MAGGGRGCWGKPDLGSLTGSFMEDSAEATFWAASCILSVFSRLFSSMSHCVRKASRKQEKAPTPLRTGDLTYPVPYLPSLKWLLGASGPKVRLRSGLKMPKLQGKRVKEKRDIMGC